MKQKLWLFVGCFSAGLFLVIYGIFVSLSINAMSIHKLIGYSIYPDKILVEEWIYFPRIRSSLLEEIKARDDQSTLEDLREIGTSPYTIIKWADLDFNNSYDEERLSRAIEVLSLLESKGFGLSNLNLSGCSAFHEAKMNKDMEAIHILRKQYEISVIEGNQSATIEECRDSINVDNLVTKN